MSFNLHLTVFTKLWPNIAILMGRHQASVCFAVNGLFQMHITNEENNTLTSSTGESAEDMNSRGLDIPHKGSLALLCHAMDQFPEY